jgi:hypothetical protein
MEWTWKASEEINETIRTTKGISSMNKMKVAKAIFCISILANLITGCDNSKTANDDNFKKAIATDVLPEEQLNCFALSSSDEGFGLTKPMDFPIEIAKQKAVALAEIQALTKAGLLSTSEGREELTIGFQRVPTTKYTLTKEGEKFFKRALTSYDSKFNGFCVGEAEVDKVINFTDPQNEDGTTISKVKYSYKIKNYPSWLSNSEIQAAFPYAAKMVQSQNKPLESTTKLFLTSKGWAGKL